VEHQCLISLASSESTVVEHLTHNPKIRGLNPTTGTKRGGKCLEEMIKYSPNGLNPANGTES
jgi:hypothetical protein